jgi:hypothetical protein
MVLTERQILSLIALCGIWFPPAAGFAILSPRLWLSHSQSTTPQAPSRTRPTLFSTANALTTLTEATTWNVRLVLRGAATERGKKVNEIFTLAAQFVEEEGYEPPQGSLQQVPKPNDRLTIATSRWILSEDPSERKDGLWVWGLFKEPLYPYLLLQMETARIPLPGSGGAGDGSDEDAIVPLKLYAQIRHKREKDVGVVLEGSQLSLRVVETVKADPFGAAKVDLYNNLEVGTISIQPAATSSR